MPAKKEKNKAKVPPNNWLPLPATCILMSSRASAAGARESDSAHKGWGLRLLNLRWGKSEGNAKDGGSEAGRLCLNGLHLQEKKPNKKKTNQGTAADEEARYFDLSYQTFFYN